MEKKTWLMLVVVAVVCAFGVLAVKTAVNNAVSKKIQEKEELHAKEIAEYRLQCETSKLEQENLLKKQNAELVNELEKAKIMIEKLKKQGQYSNMLKNDINGFMKEVDSILGVKGKEKNDK